MTVFSKGPKMIRHDKPRTTVHCLSDIELNQLLTATQCTWHNALFTILADTGLRNAEVCALMVRDLWFLDQPVSTLDVRAEIAKNHKPRSLPLTVRAIEAIAFLEAHHWIHDVDPLKHYAFYGRNWHTPISKRTIHRLCAKYGSAVLHKHLHPHMLRHTYATRLMRMTNIRVVQQLLGHTSLASTQIYTHPTATDLNDAVNKLNHPDANHQAAKSSSTTMSPGQQ